MNARTAAGMGFATEREFQRAITDAASLFSWRWYHTHTSRNSPPGFPDLCMVRGPVGLFVELKSDKGRLSKPQQEWGYALRRVERVEYHLWRPSDFHDAIDLLRPEPEQLTLRSGSKRHEKARQ